MLVDLNNKLTDAGSKFVNRVTLQQFLIGEGVTTRDPHDGKMATNCGKTKGLLLNILTVWPSGEHGMLLPGLHDYEVVLDAATKCKDLFYEAGAMMVIPWITRASMDNDARLILNIGKGRPGEWLNPKIQDLDHFRAQLSKCGLTEGMDFIVRMQR